MPEKVSGGASSYAKVATLYFAFERRQMIIINMQQFDKYAIKL